MGPEELRPNVGHYAGGCVSGPLGKEPWDIIEAAGLEPHYSLGNLIKYLMRAPYKGQFDSDIKKAHDYVDHIAYIMQEHAKRQEQSAGDTP